MARVKFLPGKLEEWKRLTAEAMHIVRTRDSGTLQYDLPVLAMPPAQLRASVFNADESEALVFERYRDADAALERFSNIGHLMASLMETATITDELLGAPNDQIRNNLTGDQPKLYEPWLALSDQPAAQ